MDIDASNTSAIVKCVRTATGMTQEELARTICVTVSTVNHWEQKRAKMSGLAYLTIIAYAKMRKIDLHSLEVQNGLPEQPPFRCTTPYRNTKPRENEAHAPPIPS